MARFDADFPPVIPLGTRTLSLGAQGSDVAILQTMYNQLVGVLAPPTGSVGAPIEVTGVYDASTIAAIEAIQGYFGIGVDGVAGPETFWVFGQGVGRHVTFGGPAFGSRLLSPGICGGDVTVLQNRLACFRYEAALGGPASGFYTPQTAGAVAELQGDADDQGDTGLLASGVVGPATLNALWLYTVAGGRSLFIGRNGYDVAWVQRLLHDCDRKRIRIADRQ